MSLPLEPEHRDALKEELVYTPREIHVFLNNAARACEWQFAPAPKSQRGKVMTAVRAAAVQEFGRWITASDLAVSREELVYLFSSLAFEFHQKEEPRG